MRLEIPLPLPDEVIYSTISRARMRLGWKTTRISQAIFDGRFIVVRPHLCGQIDHVAASLAANADWPYTADELRELHTIATLAKYVLPDPFYKNCISALHGNQTGRSYVGHCRRVLGLTPFTELRSCPHCRKHDRTRYGEAYMHRIHQVPGLDMCVHHEAPLEACAISAEPNHYIALDEVPEFHRLQVPRDQLTRQVSTGREILRLLRLPLGSTEELESIAKLQRTTNDLQSVASNIYDFVSDPVGMAPMYIFERRRILDEEWLQFAHQHLPAMVSELKSTYTKRIVWMTLKRRLEVALRARMPPRNRVLRTAALIESFIEDSAAASRRLAHLRQNRQQIAKAA